MASVHHSSASRPRNASVPTLLVPEGRQRHHGALNPFADQHSPAVSQRSETRMRRPRTPGQAPPHPIPLMQDAFAESLAEATSENLPERPRLRVGDARRRRKMLVDQDESGRFYEQDLALWRKRPGQKHHELWKLMAQISFGVYLLLSGLASNDRQVVGILQGHIDDVDEFLEVTMEDLQHTIADLNDRQDLLRLPMENMDVFEKMLEDRNFRFQIVSGNEKIEKILNVTRRCLDETIKDVHEGLEATREFAIYIAAQGDGEWRSKRPGMMDIYGAMKGNTDGWMNALIDLEAKTKSLADLVARLGGIIDDMDRKAGEVSRRTRFSINPYSSPGSEPNSGESTPRASILATSPRSRGPLSPQSILIARESLFGRRASNASAKTYSVRESRETLPAFQFKPPPPVVDVVAEADEGNFDSRRESPNLADEEPLDDVPLYILQPRTYTPQPPEPLPSPVMYPQEPSSPERSPRQSELPPKRTSLRDRVSLKTHPPESIQVPPPNALDFQRPIRSSPRPVQPCAAPDSAYGSDVEPRPTINSVADPTIPELSPPVINAGLMPSPRSDQQRYFPVQASPHSPLQQRPWTASGMSMLAQGPPIGHVRNKPSQMGMSMLSNVTSVSDLQSEGGTKIKKKRSAFGWLRKAFTLDDEERTEYEQKRQQRAHNPYFDPKSPKYLDGKRVDQRR